MKEKVLNYLKFAGLFTAYHPISHWGGVFISGILSVIVAFIAKDNYVQPLSTYVEQFFLCTIPFVFLFVLVYVTAARTQYFSPKFIVFSVIPLFVMQHVYILLFGASFWINGISANLCFLWFPAYYNIVRWPTALIQLGLQVFVYLPIYMLASYCGCQRGLKNAE